MRSSQDLLLGTREAAERLGVAEGTLRFWRHRGAGPRSFRLGGRKVKYRLDDIDAWLADQYQQDPRGGAPALGDASKEQVAEG